MSDKSELGYQAFWDSLQDRVKAQISLWPDSLQAQLKKAYEDEAKKPNFDIFIMIELANNLNDQKDPFFQKIGEMPQGFRLSFLNFTKRAPRNNSRLRNKFNRKVRSEFLEYIAYTKPQALKSLGLTATDIEKMKSGRYPAAKSKKGECFPIINVEHVIPISGGGENGFDNLYLVPQYINEYTGWLLESQTRGLKEGDRKVILLTVPIKGPRQGYNVYPYPAPRQCDKPAAPKCKCA